MLIIQHWFLQFNENVKGEFQGKPRQEGPWCALKGTLNIKETFTLKCFEAT